MSKHAGESRDETRERQSYSRPALREFGPVGKLTQAGTGQAREGSGNQMNDMTRRP